jgi:nucleoside-diphosphate-sugar epimerase
VVKVLVTGGTGYVGAYAVKALLAAGHSPRLLVRNPARLATTLGAIGVDTGALDIAPGDMTDAMAVAGAVDGVDAVIHSAALVSALNRADAARTIEVNVSGTRTVVGAALAAGCDPVIHISSVAALFTPAAPLITSDLEPAVGAQNAYTRSKALADAFVRERQAAGAPVTIVYPGGVSGPAAGEATSEVAEGVVAMLRPGVVPLRDGGFSMIDVRDLAEVIVATLEPGKGPRRFMAGGALLDMRELTDLLEAATGRDIRLIPTPGYVFRGVGRLLDQVRRVVPFDTIYTAEAMDLLTLARPTDDTAVHDVPGVTYRPPIDTMTAMIRSLYDAGRLTAMQVGRVAT